MAFPKLVGQIREANFDLYFSGYIQAHGYTDVGAAKPEKINRTIYYNSCI